MLYPLSYEGQWFCCESWSNLGHMSGNLVYRDFNKKTKLHTWRLRVWDGERQVSQTFKAPGGKRESEQAANEELAKMVRRVARNPGVDHDRTLSDLWEAFYDRVVPDLSPTTQRGYRSVMKGVILPALGPTKLRDLTSYQLDAFYAKQRKRVSARSVLSYHRLLSTVCRQAERWGWLEVSPVRNATPPQVPRSEVVSPSLDVVLSLVQSAEGLVQLLIVLAAALGARRAELVGLRWDDIDYVSGTVRIERSIYEVPGGGVAVKSTKTDRPRIVTLDSASLSALRTLSAGRSGYVFSKTGETPWRPTRATREYMRVRDLVPAAKGIRLHALRHWHASNLISQGFDPVTVSKRLGHANPTTTLAIYSHALAQRDQAAADAIGDLLSSNQVDSGGDGLVVDLGIDGRSLGVGVSEGVLNDQE